MAISFLYGYHCTCGNPKIEAIMSKSKCFSMFTIADWQNRYALAAPPRFPKEQCCIEAISTIRQQICPIQSKAEVHLVTDLGRNAGGLFDVALADRDLRLDKPK